MRKAYKKPSLFAESFELVEHITSCTLLGQANHKDITSCGFKNDDSGFLFLDSLPSKCDYNPYPDDDEAINSENENNECHYTFGVAYAIFSS